MGVKFRTNDVAEWMGRAYTTVRGHLLNLVSLGILESGPDNKGVFYRVVAFKPWGEKLPSPQELKDLLDDQELGGTDDDIGLEV